MMIIEGQIQQEMQEMQEILGITGDYWGLLSNPTWMPLSTQQPNAPRLSFGLGSWIAGQDPKVWGARSQITNSPIREGNGHDKVIVLTADSGRQNDNRELTEQTAGNRQPSATQNDWDKLRSSGLDLSIHRYDVVTHPKKMQNRESQNYTRNIPRNTEIYQKHTRNGLSRPADW